MPEVANTREQEFFWADNGKPFVNRKAAEIAMPNLNLSANDWGVFQAADNSGWEIRKIKKQPAPVQQLEKFYRVKFAAKASPNDHDDVVLAVNGEVLVAQREKEIVIPARFREAADHAYYQQFKQLPGMPRKIVGKVLVYPYQFIGDATEQEYRTMLTEGTRKQRADVARYGFDVDPDQVGA